MSTCSLLRITFTSSQWWFQAVHWQPVVFRHGCVHAQSCPTLSNPIDCSPPASSVRGITQARILEWVPISYSSGSSRPSDGTWVSCISYIGRRNLYHCTTCEALYTATWHHIYRFIVSSIHPPPLMAYWEIYPFLSVLPSLLLPTNCLWVTVSNSTYCLLYLIPAILFARFYDTGAWLIWVHMINSSQSGGWCLSGQWSSDRGWTCLKRAINLIPVLCTFMIYLWHSFSCCNLPTPDLHFLFDDFHSRLSCFEVILLGGKRQKQIRNSKFCFFSSSLDCVCNALERNSFWLLETHEATVKIWQML